jgi:DNA (cytosine-5)-methyltransferase 1
MIKVGSDFSGVGAFNQSLKRLGIEYKEVFACDMDKYARQTFIHNYGEPEYYPTNVYDRAIPTESLDIYMTSPPCQAFSLAGKRLGKDDKRGILFFNSYEFIQTNKPRYFIFENVKGLLSDDGGRTFSEWVNMLGGKSINGNTVLFPYEESVPYHLYWQVLNAKEHGVPQNRERVFLIGIRDDQDNSFSFPKEEFLTKRLKDVLENEVDEKYFLSEKIIKGFLNKKDSENYPFIPKDENDISQCLTARYYKMGATDPYIKIKSATSKGYEEATEGDSINFSVPNSETRRGRVGKGLAQTLDTGCQQGVLVYNIPEIVSVRKHQVRIIELQQLLKNHRNISIKEISKKLNIPKTQVEHWFRTDKCFSIPDPILWFKLKECINISTNEFDLEITEFENKESIFEKSNRVYDSNGIAPTLTSTSADERVLNDYKIRRLTPRECFRLMDFPDTFSWLVSDSQAYKQAGNSIVVNVLAKIINNLKL